MPSTPKIPPRDLFWTFTALSLRGFGGVMPWVYRELVEKKQWLSNEEFAELIGLGQILPGANVTNFSVMFGYRVAGWRGALASVMGLLALPFLGILLIGVFYQHFGDWKPFQGALRGATSVAAGMVLATGLKLGRPMARNWRAWIYGGSALLGVGIFEWPLPWVVLVVIPAALLAEWKWRQ